MDLTCALQFRIKKVPIERHDDLIGKHPSQLPDRILTSDLPPYHAYCMSCSRVIFLNAHDPKASRAKCECGTYCEELTSGFLLSYCKGSNGYPDPKSMIVLKINR